MTQPISVSQFLQAIFANGVVVKNSGFKRGDKSPFEVKEAIDRDIASAADAVSWMEEVDSEFRQGMRLALLTHNQVAQSNPDLSKVTLDRSTLTPAMNEGYDAVICC